MTPAIDPRYPIGKFQAPATIGSAERAAFIAVIEAAAGEYRAAVAGLTDAQLDTPYRDGGWTIRQVVHHVADSHMNSFIRFKLALTEDTPTIKPYDEAAWAKLADSAMPVGASLELTEAMHQRWAVLLRSMTEADYAKSFVHPEHGRQIRLDVALAIYAWHCGHHLAHITNLKQSRGW
ncbi:MAG: bacillithiol transferase BstA [Acidobacteria bacterium]|nr:bacillithiol transferase BstA [Acidobacteriota bacterium]